jgi:hypothetical protein
MPAQALFGTSVAFGFIAWGIVAAQYFWPLLRAQATAISLPLLHSAVGIPLVWVFNLWRRPIFSTPSIKAMLPG